MSTVTTASSPRRGATKALSAARRLPADAGLGAALAAALAVVAFVTGGGTDLSANTWVEIALTIVGAGIAIAATVLSGAGRAWGGPSLLMFAALSALTAASIAWSVQPADSWVEANRTVSYLAAFGGALALARVFPGRWRALVGAVAVAATIVCGYALLVKVFPATLDSSDMIGRLRLPFDYPNAVGQIAAMGVPACLWAGARREAGVLVRTLSVPALGVLALAIMLSYSRGAIVIVVVGLAVWFALVPLRLRAALVLGLGVVGAGIATAWALHTHTLTHNNVALAARTSTGHKFGLVLVAMLAIQAVAGFVAARAVDRRPVSEATRRRLGAALVALVVVIAIGGVGAVAASSRGLTGTVSHVWSQLTSPNSGGASDSPSRVFSTGSSRGRYWNEGLTVGRHALLKGVGAGGFATAHHRYYASVGAVAVQHAHSYLIETFADLGLIGLAVTLGLLIAWAIAAARAIGARRRGPPADLGPGAAAERIGLITLLATVIVFGLGSAIDWTWFIPGTVLPALVCAGWLAGRGPLERPIGRIGRPRLRNPGAIAGITATAGIALLIAWTIAQPLRSANADAAALTAVTRGDTAAAIADARAAAREDPVSVDPLFELAAIYHASGDNAAAVSEMQQAVQRQPDNPDTWFQKGQLLFRLGRQREALQAFNAAAKLDRDDAVAVAILLYQQKHPRARVK